MRIGVVVGSTRPGRRGGAVGAWVLEQAASREAEYVSLDVADFGLVLLDEEGLPSDVDRQYASEATRRWSREVDACDGFVFVTPEYNHGLPAAMKNAVDLIWPEWNHKAVGFVAYGMDSGVRVVEQWRPVVAAVMMHDVRSQVSLSNFTDWDDDQRFAPLDRRAGELGKVLGQVETLAELLAPLRG